MKKTQRKGSSKKKSAPIPFYTPRVAEIPPSPFGPHVEKLLSKCVGIPNNACGTVLKSVIPRFVDKAELMLANITIESSSVVTGGGSGGRLQYMSAHDTSIFRLRIEIWEETPVVEIVVRGHVPNTNLRHRLDGILRAIDTISSADRVTREKLKHEQRFIPECRGTTEAELLLWIVYEKFETDRFHLEQLYSAARLRLEARFASRDVTRDVLVRLARKERGWVEALPNPNTKDQKQSYRITPAGIKKVKSLENS